ncbi:hypothetical protein F5Y05DRAFT_242853 [Hypoxylon sp. FL0543]|nr:hypothetical protein F5Y05DRAFT_242853 [Hypoxylon sp. FL0543]
MAQVYCACIISNLEGRRIRPSQPARLENELGFTLEALDQRTRWLESRQRITSPPPLLETSWDSLMWRVCRLSRMQPGAVLTKSVPLHNAASLSLLKSAIATIGFESCLPWSDKENLAEKDLLALAAQWLWRYAGQRGYELKDPSFELGAICSLALDLSLEAETLPGGLRMPGARRPPVQPFVQPLSIVQNRKTCCGCCSCNCHRSRSRSRDSSVISGRRRGKWQVFGWVKRLAFWRKRSVADDSSSIASTLTDV